MKTKLIQVYTDSGHGWAKVKRSELVKYLLCGKISSCSYQKNDYVYLEGDCDLGIYIDALKANGIDYKFKESHTNKRSKIRSYDRFYSPIKTFIDTKIIFQKVGE